MLITVLKSKIHRARVTEADLEYEGSITIDNDLIKAAKLIPYELVHVYNITNGERFETYVIEGDESSGVICLNGAAARKASIGDRLIIASYVQMDEKEVRNHYPRIIVVDDENKVTHQFVKGKLKPVDVKTGKASDSWLLEP